MKTKVITFNEVQGLHRWLTAPEDNYLKNVHRHVFIIRCWFNVSHSDRDIEIIEKQNEIQEALNRGFYKKDQEMLNFEDMSCEMIAQWLINETGCSKAVVLEDGYGGAEVEKC